MFSWAKAVTIFVGTIEASKAAGPGCVGAESGTAAEASMSSGAAPPPKAQRPKLTSPREAASHSAPGASGEIDGGGDGDVDGGGEGETDGGGGEGDVDGGASGNRQLVNPWTGGSY